MRCGRSPPDANRNAPATTRTHRHTARGKEGEAGQVSRSWSSASREARSLRRSRWKWEKYAVAINRCEVVGWQMRAGTGIQESDPRQGDDLRCGGWSRGHDSPGVIG